MAGFATSPNYSVFPPRSTEEANVAPLLEITPPTNCTRRFLAHWPRKECASIQPLAYFVRNVCT
jgi:hypothetical protein